MNRLSHAHPDAEGRARRLTRWFFIIAYAFAGAMHVTAPAGFVAITPRWVPEPARVVWLTGLCEMAGALGLALPRAWLRRARPAAATGLALYALCVWPANLNHALHDIPIGGVHLGWWYHGPRLLLQPVIIWAALWAGGVTDWPLRRVRPGQAIAPAPVPGQHEPAA